MPLSVRSASLPNRPLRLNEQDVLCPATSGASSFLWTGYTQILADTSRSRSLDLLMPRHGGSPLHLRVVIDGMFGAFAEENATVTFEMAQQVNTLHQIGRASCRERV